VDVSLAPEYNLDHWLDHNHPNFKPLVYQAIFYYRAHAEKNERLKVCVATPEMDEAAWQYDHKNQIILDRTFGVCSSCVLVFIAMGQNKENKGIVLAFLILYHYDRKFSHWSHPDCELNLWVQMSQSWSVHEPISRRVTESPFLSHFRFLSPPD